MLKVDLKNMMKPKLQVGLEKSELDNMHEELKSISEKFLKEKANYGFTKLPYSFDSLKDELAKADELAKEMDTILVIGIGGSDLGTRTLFRALKSHFYNMKPDGKRLFFAGDTTDPRFLSELIDILDLSKTLVLIVSKSGNTIEQGSTFVYLRNLFLEKLGEGSDVKHFVFLTDPVSGTLRKLADEKGYNTIDIPSDVGGRFSVLTSVGLVPAHYLGLNVEEFLKGAADLDKEFSGGGAGEMSEIQKALLNYVGLQYLYYKSGKNISVMFPYEYALGDFGKWYRQLWAESLGKRLSVNGKDVFEGITPVAALGPTDQHSQLQLYNEGPNDKVFTFIIAENSNHNLNLPDDYSNVEAFDFLKGHDFHEILTYEQQTTAFALTKNQRPNATITIPQIDEYHIGQLFYFFEIAVTLMGYLLNVNPFDQPGVELSKNAMYGVLGKPEYQKEKADFESYQRN